MQKYSIHELKTSINDFETSRRGIIQGADIFNNMDKLKKTMDAMQPLLKGQQVYIKKFFTSQTSISEVDKAVQFKRYLNRFCDIIKNQFNQIISIGDSYFHLNRKERKQKWEKIIKEFEEKIMEKKQTVNTNNFFDFLFTVLNMRDFIIKQFIKSIMYRKYLLWNDLNDPPQKYVHTQKNRIFQEFEIQNDNLGYIPTLIEFVPPTFEEGGKWTIFQDERQEKQASIPTLFKNMNKQYEQVLDTVRNYSKLNESPQTFQDINKNQKLVKNLRQKVQVLNLNYESLLTKYRETNLKSEEKQDIMVLKNKIEQYQLILTQKDTEINQMRVQFKGSSTIIQNLKEKVKEHEQQIDRIRNNQVSQLKQLESMQINLNAEFLKFKKQISNYAMIYKLENESKKEIIKEMQNKDVQINNLVDILGRERRNIKDLKLQISRLNSVIFELGKNFK